MAIHLIEGDPRDRKLLTKFGNSTIELRIGQEPVLHEHDVATFRELKRMLAKLNNKTKGLNTDEGVIEVYPDRTSAKGEDPLQTAYTIYSDPDPMDGELVQSRLAIAVGNPRHVYDSKIEDITGDYRLGFKDKNEKLSTLYTRETENGMPYVVVTLMSPGVSYKVDSDSLASIRWDFDPDTNRIVTTGQVGSSRSVIDTSNYELRTNTNMSVTTFSNARNDAVRRAVLASNSPYLS